MRLAQWTAILLFQSTPSWRGRRRYGHVEYPEWVISIHALVKRATRWTVWERWVYRHFNPRPREEGDLMTYGKTAGEELFQSTPSWRGRPLHRSVRRRYYISIHALVKRATASGTTLPTRSAISIHALVKRATIAHLCRHIQIFISIHALVKRATIALISVSLSYIYFNPRPREEGDTTIWLLHLRKRYFNPRPREEGDRG